MDFNENNKSKEMKTHGHKEITHQKPGHSDPNENMENKEKEAEEN